MRNILFFVGMLHIANVVQASVLGDRLVVEINSIAFTQRQVELHWLVSALLMSKEQKTGITKQNWRQVVREFSEDMVLLQEGERTGLYRTDPKKAQQAAEELTQKLQSKPEAVDELKRLSIDTQELAGTVSVVLSIRAYEERRNKSETDLARGDEAKAKHWKRELIRRAIIRRFNGADSYIKLEPRKFFKSDGS